MKKSTGLLLLFIIGSIITAGAQPYKTAMGLRISPLYGVTIKHMNSAQVGIEGIVSGRWNGIQVTGLYEKHNLAFQQQRLQAYAGIGGHVALWRDGRYNPWYGRGFLAWDRNDFDWDYYNRNRDPDLGRVVVGMDMIIGLEYTIKDLPLSFSLDWKPFLNIIGGGSLFVEDVGFSVRFVFD